MSESVYVGVVGADYEIGICRDSIEKIRLRNGDTHPAFARATKGFEARQLHINKFLESTHDYILLLDSDMIFPPHTLERLRSHGLPYVSGFYMRRTLSPLLPVWFERSAPGVMPMRPMISVLARDTLYPIGASGWGCVLIRRDVIEKTRALLKGEAEVIEDDMDIYPYDLPRLLNARNLLVDALAGKVHDAQAIRSAIRTVTEEIRPLRCVKDNVGSDIRFPFFARLAGFELWGDTGVVCEHVTTYPLSMQDWMSQSVDAFVRSASAIIRMDEEERERLQKARQ